MFEQFLVLSIPFTLFGIWVLMNKVKQILQVRKGFFKVTFRMANHRKKSIMMKPEKTWFKYKDRIYSFSEDAGFIYYNSGTPEIEYDYDGNQINFDEMREKNSLDPSRLHQLCMRFYNLGKMSGKVKDKWTLVLLAVSCGTSVLCLLMLVSMQNPGITL